jgi:hypothetical protein
VKQKQQKNNTKLNQEVELTVTQAKHEAMSQNAATKKFRSNLTLKTAEEQDSLITGQLATQHLPSKKKITALKQKVLCG